MNLLLEIKKIKRTGIIPAFIIMALLAGAVPIINISVRSQLFTSATGSPLSILINENWQLMTMLNVLIISVGACLFYNIEYADNAIQKMKALPIRESSLFISKSIVLAFMSVIVMLIESAAFLFCILHWFKDREFDISDLFCHFGYSVLMVMPSVILSLMISSMCRNMWVSLGIQVVCIFTATMIPINKFVLSIFPYALPFQSYTAADAELILKYVIVTVIELMILVLAEVLLTGIRRCLE